MGRRTKGRLRKSAEPLILGAALACVAAALAVPARASDVVTVTAADWKPEKSVLRIEGTSTTPDAVVLVRDAESRALLGSAAVRADGKWMLKIRDPAAVPSRARVELGSRCVECDVTGPAVAR